MDELAQDGVILFDNEGNDNDEEDGGSVAKKLNKMSKKEREEMTKTLSLKYDELEQLTDADALALTGATILTVDADKA